MQVPDPIPPSEVAAAAVPTANVQVQRAGGAVVLTARGEFDVITTPVLQQGILEALAPAPDRLVLDLSGTTFFSSAAFGCLVDARSRAGEHTVLQLVAAHEVRRNLALLGLEPLFSVFDTLADAQAAAG
ncbi:STAS domain-containing protein [Amycolatopsis sp. FDAARGOS 1241]|uniref:STAS domain-containing protein n=1 Tax=Amycolatopsis sp. FDAARGOS 1241 TaxID=2778070 RepID=UPI0019511F7E|nr:STAS domain-containing protein [Amycolatopsis sp. FDAARGOS 1241]QRP42814.1 STAS domain-containing protein [Amycolatopsis sp. FDAARGOS 1241]